MKRFSLITLLMLSMTSNSLAADATINPNIPKQGKSLSKPKATTVDENKLKQEIYSVTVQAHISTDQKGKRGYYAKVHSQSKTATIPPNTLELVVVRKYDGGETLLGTYPVTTALTPPPTQGNSFMIQNDLPFCCSAREHEVRVRVKGSNTILAKTSMHTGSSRILTISNHKISNNGTTYSVKFHQRTSEHKEAVVKMTVMRNGKQVELGQNTIVIPPRDSAFSLVCGKVKENETPTVTAYEKTTCANDTPEQCYMGESHGAWSR